MKSSLTSLYVSDILTKQHKSVCLVRLVWPLQKPAGQLITARGDKYTNTQTQTHALASQ